MEPIEDHYGVLRLDQSCTASEIKASYRSLVILHHPDKGGDSVEFTTIQKAYETLSDPRKRVIYEQQLFSLKDKWKQAERSTEIQESSFLISHLSRSYTDIDPLKQLVVCCHLCLRPSSFICWICSSPLCLFCSRTPHSRDEHPMHWPLNNTSHMIDRLGMAEMERKRKEDADRYEREDPCYQPLHQRQEARRFKELSCRAYLEETGGLNFSAPLLKHLRDLGSFYAWTQTADVVVLTCYNPFFLPMKPDLAPQVQLTTSNGMSISIQAQSDQVLPPILHRTFPHSSIDPSIPFEFVTRGSLIGLIFPKAQPGRRWTRLFIGDEIATRFFDCSGSISCPASYKTIALEKNELTMEMSLPPWIKPSDVEIEITADRIEIRVVGLMEVGEGLIRTLSSSRKTKPESCGWALISSEGKAQVLSIDLILEPVESEAKGRKEDGALFVEDEDPFGLQTFLSQLVKTAECNI